MRPVLLTSGQQTSTAGLLTEAARKRGMEVREGGDLRGLEGRTVHWYGGPAAAERVATQLGIGLLEPPDDWLVGLPEEFTGRRIELTTISEAWSVREPRFVKPPRDKTFPAAVYSDGSQLTQSVGPDTPVLMSEVVSFAAEYRMFVLDREVVTGSRYSVHGRLEVGPLEREAREFAVRLLDASGNDLPNAVAIDVGLIQDRSTGRKTWAAVEANMAWFAHCYAADPERVLDVVLKATGPRDQFSPEDKAFLRDGTL